MISSAGKGGGVPGKGRGDGGRLRHDPEDLARSASREFFRRLFAECPFVMLVAHPDGAFLKLLAACWNTRMNRRRMPSNEMSDFPSAVRLQGLNRLEPHVLAQRGTEPGDTARLRRRCCSVKCRRSEPRLASIDSGECAGFARSADALPLDRRLGPAAVWVNRGRIVIFCGRCVNRARCCAGPRPAPRRAPGRDLGVGQPSRAEIAPFRCFSHCGDVIRCRTSTR